MNDAEYRKIKKGDKVRVIRTIRTGYVVLPVGAIATVTYKHGGLNLDGPPCKCCGVRVVVRKASQYDVEVVKDVL